MKLKSRIQCQKQLEDKIKEKKLGKKSFNIILFPRFLQKMYSIRLKYDILFSNNNYNHLNFRWLFQFSIRISDCNKFDSFEKTCLQLNFFISYSLKKLCDIVSNHTHLNWLKFYLLYMISTFYLRKKNFLESKNLSKHCEMNVIYIKDLI